MPGEAESAVEDARGGAAVAVVPGADGAGQGDQDLAKRFKLVGESRGR